MDNRDLADRSHLVEREEYIDEETWETIVQSMPIPSVDLVVKCPEGILLGKRANEPAKGEWFIPGGRIQKGEPLREAVHRIAEEELGIEVTIERSLGAYDHFYDASDVPESGGKHYIAHAYVVSATECDVIGDDQHSELRVFETIPSGLHSHVKIYFSEANVI
ncbi:NUDIX domain-containing protein [Halanaeroarchaeum sulfurireducens]|uniref:GDP-mannose mannosyl hydrolase n=1 Tax=Halanaeroarchaeum sulfurireducens TaxID=1604004 RepID=A0A0F7P8E2_9EURY|nr:NUDIX domain-containing protein [Halanaeroarchaeum sulfurireducens]AKH97431.1 GDP-mannose mannosyl hydrolase [Halanaeroarchaeum sulfurireducens]ALG81827.1 GDP-mannose mannosyl hydrolase [Halanaeroarchaeum sulfurireducens]